MELWCGYTLNMDDICDGVVFGPQDGAPVG